VNDSDPNVVSLRREIQVLDVNDQRPAFQGVPYTFKVSEDAAVGMTLFRAIRVSDADAGSNAELKLRCDENKDKDACETFETRLVRGGDGTFHGLVKLRRRLDYETRASYNIPVVVADQGPEVSLSSEISVLVEVVDLQDQPPVFKNSPYSVVVPENLPPVGCDARNDLSA
jgi:hypothetical protein